jgi:putative ABC transport system permease protein
MARFTGDWLRLLLRFAWEGLSGQRGRSALTILGMAIGTASVVAVVSIGLVGREYVVGLIEGVGSNLVFAYGTGEGINPEEVSFSDVDVFLEQVDGVAAIAPVLNIDQTLSIRGQAWPVTVLGVTPSYSDVRNIVMEHGRFITEREDENAEKVCAISEELAERLYGGPPPPDATIRLFDLRFRVIGVAREGVQSAAAVQASEITDLTAIVPFSTLRTVTGLRYLDVVYMTAESREAVPLVVDGVKRVLASRYRSLSNFRVESLQSYLVLARQVSDAITLVLLGIAGVSLLVGAAQRHPGPVPARSDASEPDRGHPRHPGGRRGAALRGRPVQHAGSHLAGQRGGGVRRIVGRGDLLRPVSRAKGGEHEHRGRPRP